MNTIVRVGVSSSDRMMTWRVIMVWHTNDFSVSFLGGAPASFLVSKSQAVVGDSLGFSLSLGF